MPRQKTVTASDSSHDFKQYGLTKTELRDYLSKPEEVWCPYHHLMMDFRTCKCHSLGCCQRMINGL